MAFWAFFTSSGRHELVERWELSLKPRTDDQVFLDKFFLDKEPCSKAGHGSFWTRFLVKEKLPNLCRTHEQIKLVKDKFANVHACTHELLKLVKENCWGKTCSSYTRARKPTKELVKENFVVCARLKCN